jgi:hypothetical protein
MNTKSLVLGFTLMALAGCVAHVSESGLVRATAGTQLIDGTSSDGQWEIRALQIPRPEDVRLSAALFTRPNSRALVLYLGGNVFVISNHYQQILSVYSSEPVDVLMVDYRGYGASTGEASLNSLMGDAVPIYDFARALVSYEGKPVVVHGHSLGSFMAGEIANERTLDGLVLEASATTAEDWLQGFVDNTVFVRRGVVEGELKGKGNLQVMAGLDEHVLFVVGEKDTTTRSDMSAKLFAAAGVPSDWKELVVVPNAGHNGASMSNEYAEAFTRLLARIGHE